MEYTKKIWVIVTSQKIVYSILKELGGRATSKEIREIVSKRWPSRTMQFYIANRLRKLEKKGVIKLISRKGVKKSSVFMWEIAKPLE